MQTIVSIADLEQIKNKYEEELAKYRFQVMICAGAGCISCSCMDVKKAVEDEISLLKLQKEVIVIETGCMGTCAV